MSQSFYRPSLYARVWTWLKARDDGARSYPAEDATSLSETERGIVKFAETGRTDLVKGFNGEAAHLIAERERHAEALGRIKENWDTLKTKAGRTEPIILLSPHWYWVTAFIVVPGEAAINANAFNAIAETPLGAIVMAAGLGLCIMICAHFLGITIRQWSRHESPIGHVMRALKSLVILALVISVLYYVQELRTQYFAENGTALSKGLALALYAVSGVIFAGAVLVTYMTTDPVEQFVETKAKLEDALQDKAEIDGKMNEIKSGLVGDLSVTEDIARQLLLLYRRRNRCSRPGAGKTPRYFDDEKAPHHDPSFAGLWFKEEKNHLSAGLGVPPADDSPGTVGGASILHLTRPEKENDECADAAVVKAS